MQFYRQLGTIKKCQVATTLNSFRSSWHDWRTGERRQKIKKKKKTNKILQMMEHSSTCQFHFHHISFLAFCPLPSHHHQHQHTRMILTARHFPTAAAISCCCWMNRCSLSLARFLTLSFGKMWHNTMKLILSDAISHSLPCGI